MTFEHWCIFHVGMWLLILSNFKFLKDCECYHQEPDRQPREHEVSMCLLQSRCNYQDCPFIGERDCYTRNQEVKRSIVAIEKG